MKNLFIVFALCCISIFSADAQDKVNPIDVLEGTWMLKVQTVAPIPADNSWETTNTIVNFETILDGNGLKQTTYREFDETEAYFFFDAANGILYGTSVDANGYVWQTKMGLNNQGNFDTTIGGPIGDETLKIKNDLKIVSKSELSFAHSEYKNGKEVLKAVGVFHRLPEMPGR